MPTGFYKLKVAKINQETKDAVSIELMVPPPFRKEFEYKAGQYLTFSIEINGEEVRRSYSLCTSPDDSTMAVAVKKVEGGKMSNYLNNELKEGQLIDTMPPNGNFIYEADSGQNRNLFLFGGGSGVTPVKSILLSALKNELGSNITMVYANRDQESIIFGQELDALAEEYSSRFKLIHSLDNPPANWDGLSGYLNKDVISSVLNSELGSAQNDATYYICGPGPMMDVVTASLADLGIGEEKIITEYFVAKKSDSSSENKVPSGPPAFGTYDIEVELFGDEEALTVKESETILDAAIQADLDPPYSCQSGVCTTCRAKLLSGNVHMKEREGLTDDEVQAGYILTCQSHPISEGVKVRYE